MTRLQGQGPPRTASGKAGGRALRLGIEAGATHTVAILADDADRALARISTGPANIRLLDEPALRRHFQEIARRLPKPTALAIGMAGARTETDRSRIRAAAGVAWPGVPCLATNDLETALQAASAPRHRVDAEAAALVQKQPRVLVLSGTGSCCFSRAGKRTAKVGGWGHILGDKGSGYEIGLRGLKAVVYYYDQTGVWPKLGRRILRALQFNEPNDLISWAQQASKAEMASLALEVLAAWDEKDNIAEDILAAAANSLARDAATCAERLLRGHKITKARNRRTTALQGLEFIFA